MKIQGPDPWVCITSVIYIKTVMKLIQTWDSKSGKILE